MSACMYPGTRTRTHYGRLYGSSIKIQRIDSFLYVAPCLATRVSECPIVKLSSQEERMNNTIRSDRLKERVWEMENKFLAQARTFRTYRTYVLYIGQQPFNQH